MGVRRIDGFFYGLFMDSGVLREHRVSPDNPRRAYVDHFALRLGRRATLTPCAGARAYGMAFSLTHSDIAKLYAGPGLEAYLPEAVAAQVIGGEIVPAICYNLVEVPGADESNPEYAARLRDALTKLNFPPAYVESVS